MEECQAKQKIKVEKGDGADVNFPLEVKDEKGMKWKSVGVNLHDQIPVVDQDAGVQLWLLERAEHELLWSFSPSSGEKKLYVSYNCNDPTDESLTLEYADDVTKGRYFQLLLQPGGRLRVRLPDLPDRVIGIKNNVLALVQPGESGEEGLKWGLSAEYKSGFIKVQIKFKIQEYEGSRFVHHHENGYQNNVKVGLSEDSEWIWNKTGENAFRVPWKWLYIASVANNRIRYNLHLPLGPLPKAMQFKLKKSILGRGMVFESVKYSGHYIIIEDGEGRGDAFLSLVDKEKDASTWDIYPTSIVIQIGEKDSSNPR